MGKTMTEKEVQEFCKSKGIYGNQFTEIVTRSDGWSEWDETHVDWFTVAKVVQLAKEEAAQEFFDRLHYAAVNHWHGAPGIEKLCKLEREYAMELADDIFEDMCPDRFEEVLEKRGYKDE